MLFNIFKTVTGNIVENYLAKHCSSKQKVSKIRKRLDNVLISSYSETDGKLIRYLNVVLSSEEFEWIFFTYRSDIDYNNETFKILNLK